MSENNSEPLLQFFKYSHLTNVKMRDTSKHFHDLACKIVTMVPRNSERTVALRKLLEAKDCAVRAEIYEP